MIVKYKPILAVQQLFIKSMKTATIKKGIPSKIVTSLRSHSDLNVLFSSIIYLFKTIICHFISFAFTFTQLKIKGSKIYLLLQLLLSICYHYKL
jgi:hypothetical protein